MYASTCTHMSVLTLSLYMIMHVLNKLSFSLPSIHVDVCPSVCLMCLSIHPYVCIYVCVCVCVCVCVRACVRACVRVRARARACVLVPCADPVFWPSGLDPPPPDKKSWIMPCLGPHGCPSTH